MLTFAFYFELISKIKWVKSLVGDNRLVRSLFIYITYFCYILTFSGFFYLIEQQATPPFELDPRMGGYSSNCLRNHGYAGALYYAFTAATTFAYGHLKLCSIVGRLISLIYSLVGLPFTVLLLGDLGAQLCDMLVWCISKCQKRTCFQIKDKHAKLNLAKPLTEVSTTNQLPKNILVDADDKSLKDKFYTRPSVVIMIDSEHDSHAALDKARNVEKGTTTANRRDFDNQIMEIKQPRYDDGKSVDKTDADLFNDIDPDLPLGLCILLLLGWILLLAVYIYLVDSHPLGYSIYYSFAFVILQDYEGVDFRHVFPTFVILIIGLAFISTVINAAMHNSNNLVAKVQAELPAKLAELRNQAIAEGDPDREIDSTQVMQDLLAKRGNFLSRNIVSNARTESLAQFSKMSASKVDNDIKLEKAEEMLADFLSGETSSSEIAKVSLGSTQMVMVQTEESWRISDNVTMDQLSDSLRKIAKIGNDSLKVITPKLSTTMKSQYLDRVPSSSNTKVRASSMPGDRQLSKSSNTHNSNVETPPKAAIFSGMVNEPGFVNTYEHYDSSNSYLIGLEQILGIACAVLNDVGPIWPILKDVAVQSGQVNTEVSERESQTNCYEYTVSHSQTDRIETRCTEQQTRIVAFQNQSFQLKPSTSDFSCATGIIQNIDIQIQTQPEVLDSGIQTMIPIGNSVEVQTITINCADSSQQTETANAMSKSVLTEKELLPDMTYRDSLKYRDKAVTARPVMRDIRMQFPRGVPLSADVFLPKLALSRR